MIKIDSLTYTYPHSADPALNGISLSISKGDFIFITGPSGAGKSTLLRCLNGLVPHFSGGVISGSIMINGLDALEITPRVLSQLVGFVFQDPESQSVLSIVEDEIAFVLENSRTPYGEMHKKVDEILELLDLRNLRGRTLRSLSGGERQKAAIAAAMVQNPPILVLDEPTSQLDAKSAQDLLLALKRINQESGTTIILVEQRPDRILPFANRLVCVEAGQISQDEAIVDSMKSTVHGNAYPHPTSEALINQSNGHFAASSTSESFTSGGRLGNAQKNPVEPASKSSVEDRLLSINDLTSSYGEELILRGLDLEINRGEAVALIGPNGSGKTTLLKTITGLLKPLRGEIVVDGTSTNGRPVANICREVAYLPQVPDDLLFADSVEEELIVTLNNHGFDAVDHVEMIEMLLSSLDLLPYRDSYPRDLSVGQRQRVAMAAVMVTGPKLMLLDEPTRGLDSNMKRKLVGFWKNWLRKGMGLLIATHDINLAEEVADRIVILEEGALLARQGRTNRKEYLIQKK